MLFYYAEFWMVGILLILIIQVAAAYNYLVDVRRKPGDPKKHNYHPISIFLAPLTFPLFVISIVSVAFIRAVLFGMLIAFIGVWFLAHFGFRLIIISLLLVSKVLLPLFRKLLELLLTILESGLKRVFLRTGLALFILGTVLQLIALLI